jgi:hypothetical protein
VKRGLFKNKTFAIKDDCYPDEGPISTSFGEFDSKSILIEDIIRKIIENGGKVVNGMHRSHYIITEDGEDPKIWDQMNNGGLVDKMNRKIVHFRWVKQCIEQNTLVDDCDFMHLLPLP